MEGNASDDAAVAVVSVDVLAAVDAALQESRHIRTMTCPMVALRRGDYTVAYCILVMDCVLLLETGLGEGLACLVVVEDDHDYGADEAGYILGVETVADLFEPCCVLLLVVLARRSLKGRDLPLAGDSLPFRLLRHSNR